MKDQKDIMQPLLTTTLQSGQRDDRHKSYLMDTPWTQHGHPGERISALNLK